MAFPPRFLDEIRNRLSLAEAIGRRVKLTKRGREYVGLCPFHNERSPSFTVVEDKGFYHCFGCGAHGDVIGFTMRTEALPFPEAVERLAQDAGLPLPERDAQSEERAQQAKSLHDANEAAAEWFAAQLYTPEGRTGLDYLKRRAIEDGTLARFRLGYAPDQRDALKRALVAKGFPEPLLIEAGLLIKPDDGRSAYDRFRGRVMFPIGDKRGRIIAFGGRVMGDEKPKYLNSPDTPLFHKGQVLYAFREARAAAHAGKDVLVAEGYMDVIALHQAGLEGAVAPLGTALTETQIEELWKLKPEPILCFDGDEAGRRAAARAAERALPILKPGHSLRFVFLPEGEDPDSLVREGGAAAMQAVLAQSVALVDWLWRMATQGRPLDTPERRAALGKAVRERTAEIAERSVQEHYLQEFDARLRRLFAPPPRTGGRFAGLGSQARPGGARDGRWPSPRGGAEANDFSLKSDGNTDRIRDRTHQAMFAALVQHPDLIDDVGEALARLALPTGSDLDRLRDALVNSATRSLDSAALKNHLSELGFSDVLRRVLSPDVYDLERFAHPHAERERARIGWLQAFAGLIDRPAMEKELVSSERQLAEETSPRNFARLTAVKTQTAAARGAPAPGGDDPTNRRDRDRS